MEEKDMRRATAPIEVSRLVHSLIISVSCSLKDMTFRMARPTKPGEIAVRWSNVNKFGRDF